MAITITLTPTELMECVMGAVSRVLISQKQHLKPNNNCPNWNWNNDIVGVCGERAFAKHINVYYHTSVNTFKKPDVGIFQVRSTTKPDGKLTVRPGDSENEWFILVTGEGFTYKIIGGLLGADAMKEKYEWNANNRGLCWRIDQEYLTPIEQILATSGTLIGEINDCKV